MGTRKTPKAPSPLRRILGENVKNLVAVRRPELAVGRVFAKEVEGGKEDYARIMNQTHAPTIDKLHLLAKAFKLEAYQLLVPGLDASNPQTVSSCSPNGKSVVPFPDTTAREAELLDIYRQLDDMGRVALVERAKEMKCHYPRNKANPAKLSRSRKSAS